MQSKRSSLIEVTLSLITGFVISFFVWHYVGPMFGYEVTFNDNIGITSVFTVVSIVRSYIWRRIFNYIHMRQLAHQS